MKKIALAFLSLLASFQLALVAAPAMAQAPTGGQDDPLRQLQQTQISTNNDPDRLPVVIGNIVRVLMSVLGIIMVLLIIYAGFLWMTAGGDSDKVDQAKALIKNSIIGLILILLAYAITTYVITAIQRATA